jgi:hypothetical protein
MISVYPPHPINFWMPELIFMKLDMYIMATEPISVAYFINFSHQSVYPSYQCKAMTYLSVSLYLMLGNGSVNMFPQQRIHATVKELFDASFLCGLCPIKGESVGVCILLSLWANNLVKMFPWQWRIVGGIVFCAVHVILKDSRRLVLPRTSYIFRFRFLPYRVVRYF